VGVRIEHRIRDQSLDQDSEQAGGPRSVQKLESSVSRRIPVVIAKKSTKPLVAIHLPISTNPTSGSMILLSKPW
jgi:hypothetical protein